MRIRLEEQFLFLRYHRDHFPSSLQHHSNDLSMAFSSGDIVEEEEELLSSLTSSADTKHITSKSENATLFLISRYFRSRMIEVQSTFLYIVPRIVKVQFCILKVQVKSIESSMLVTSRTNFPVNTRR